MPNWNLWSGLENKQNPRYDTQRGQGANPCNGMIYYDTILTSLFPVGGGKG